MLVEEEEDGRPRDRDRVIRGLLSSTEAETRTHELPEDDTRRSRLPDDGGTSRRAEDLLREASLSVA